MWTCNRGLQEAQSIYHPDIQSDDVSSMSEVSDEEPQPSSEASQSAMEGNEGQFEEDLPDLCIESYEETIIEPMYITGRRIIDVKYFLDQINRINDHKPFSCTFNDMYLTKETRTGFFSTLTFKCKMCNLTEKIATENPKNVDQLSVNEAMVMGKIMTGSGHAHLEECSGILNMPSISKNYYQVLQNQMYDNIHSAAWDKMQEAAQKETNLVIEQGKVDSNGIPCIFVIVDGSWGKRSYNMNCTSKIGMACIIGQATQQKTSDLQEANTQQTTSDLQPSDTHLCYKNWNGSASAMEADIIAEGFRLSVSMYNIKYTIVIGDGDSSVMEKIRSQMPYGPDTVIEKIECMKFR